MNKPLCALIAALSLTVGGGTAAAEHKPTHADSRSHAEIASVESTHTDVIIHRACPHCGMDREKFAGSRMLITYTDTTTVGVCSLHCTVTELKASRNKPLKGVEVADLISRKLIDAEKAVWVVGGSKKGVMTRTAKWAFANHEDATAFISKYGGRMATYKEALTLAEKD